MSAPANATAAAGAPARIASDVVDRISQAMGEPEWMREMRHRSLEAFHRRSLPTWGGDLSELDLASLSYVPTRLLPPAPALPAELAERGVVAVDLPTALRAHEETVRAHWGAVVPADDNVFAALNGAMWTGGWLVIVPAGVAVDGALLVPRGRGDAPAGAFERTLVLVGEGASVHLIEDGEDTGGGLVHAAVTEISAGREAHVRHSGLQRWGRGVYNLATKRAVAAAGATVQWSDINLGARVTMQYPSVYLREPGASGEIVSVSIAGSGQHQDAGGKLLFGAADCAGRILSCTVAAGSGRTTFRGLVKVVPGAANAEGSVRGESLRVDAESRAETHPYIEIEEPSARIARGGMSWTLEDAAAAAATSEPLPDRALARVAAEVLAPALAELYAGHAQAVMERVAALRA